MDIRESVLLRPKTTMRIGGSARYFAELSSREDIEQALKFAAKHAVPLIPLGSGSNTLFADGVVDAFVVQIRHATVTVGAGNVTVGAGKNLAMLINELAEQGLDLSALTGIPGTVGGALFGNAGQGPKGVWIDAFVESVTVYDGAWKTFSKTECEFTYRESRFKHQKSPLVIYEAVLKLPLRDPAAIKADVQALLQKRIETQPHLKTAGSCFKAVGEIPAWKLIDEVGLRGFKVGGIEISPKHANFLMNVGEGSYDDAVHIVEEVKAKIPQKLDVEMRFVEKNGALRF